MIKEWNFIINDEKIHNEGQKALRFNNKIINEKTLRYRHRYLLRSISDVV